MIICYLNELSKLLDSTLYCTIQCSLVISIILHAVVLFWLFKEICWPLYISNIAFTITYN